MRFTSRLKDFPRCVLILRSSKKFEMMSGFITSWIWQIDTMLSRSYSDSIVNMMLKWVVTDNMCTLYMAVIRVKWLAVTMVTTVTQGQHKLGASLCKRQTTLRVSGWFLMFGSGRTLGWTLEGTGRCGSIVGFDVFIVTIKKTWRQSHPRGRCALPSSLARRPERWLI